MATFTDPSNVEEMSPADLEKLIAFVYATTRVKMDSSKKTMLSSRLHKRLRVLGLKTYSEYWKYLNSEEGKSEELPYFLDLVTTHKTNFFREEKHFESLTGYLLSKIKTVELKCWSAACSTGEEPYTLAMVLADYYEQNLNKFNILATDISTGVLKRAMTGVYHHSDLTGVAPELVKKYFLKGKGAQEGNYRVVPEIRERMKFKEINLAHDIAKQQQKFHIIFLRNVMIYFDMPTKQHIISDMEKVLEPGGYLFLGHAESLLEIQTSLIKIEATIYQMPK